MALPIRSKNPPESLPIATCALIFLNVVVYFATIDHSGAIRKDVVKEWAVSGNHFDLMHMLASMFLHGSPMHIIGNMWFLYILGFAVEGRLRSLKFLVAYFASGFAGDFLHQLMIGRLQPEMPSIGASGAIMGVMGAALYMFPYAKVSVLWGWIYWIRYTDWPMWGICAYFLGFDLLWAFLGLQDGVGHVAHIGGVLGGLLVCLIFRPKRDSEMASDAKAVLADVKDLSVLSRIELSEIARSNTEDPVLALHWMTKSLREQNGVKQDCTDMFFRLLPRMIQEIDIRSVAPCVSQVAVNYPKLVKPSELLMIAAKLERVPEPAGAMQLYELAFRTGELGENDVEAVTFRVGLLSETAFRNNAKAEQCYGEILRRWPMGPFATQAKTRLEGLAASQIRQ